MKKLSIGIFVFLFVLKVSLGQTYRPQTSSEILLKMERLGVLGSVLYFAAHPDDENTRLISYLASDRKVRTAYLSLTRGDGGQNLIGTEQGIELGLIRTQELLQARRIDGGEQFFSGAFDFGFSKTYTETFRFWNKEEILREAVWIVRKLQPDVIITRFPPDERGGHGHHQASAILAHEAFLAAGDPLKFPEQLQEVSIWTPKRLLWNTANFMRMQGEVGDQLRLDIGGYHPLLGKSHGELAALSRSQHKSQGFGSAGTNGVLLESFEHVDGDRAVEDLFDNIDLSWDRVTQDKTMQQGVDKLVAAFDPRQPQRSIPQLALLWKNIQKIDNIYWKVQKSKEIEELLLACSGIKIESLTAGASYVEGRSIPYQTEIIQRNPDVAVDIISINDQSVNERMPYNEIRYFEGKTTPASITQPYWLEKPQSPGKFEVNPQDVGYPLNKNMPSAKIELEIAGVRVLINEPLQFKSVDPVRGEVHQLVEITPSLTVAVDKQALLVRPNENKVLRLIFQNHQENKSSYRVELGSDSDGWKIEPTEITLDFDENQSYISRTVNVTNTGSGFRTAALRIRSEKQQLKKIREISYDHIPKQSWFPDAQVKLQSLEIENPVKKIAYVMGAGDLVPEALRELGIEVDLVKSEQISQAVLAKYDAVVLGIRIMNVDNHIAQKLDELYAYVENGGVVVMQYNVNTRLQKENFAPKHMKLTRARVTEEDAKVAFIDPTDPVLHYPNKISEEDFDNWVQERGLYFAEDFDKSYRTPLAMHDKNEKPHQGSLLINRMGKGKFIYTSLSFFRQLPAGVPGASRLFVNLLAKEKDDK